MCGIIGYTGNQNAIPKITEGLTVLEYRGYDSVGLAAARKSGIEIVKCRGRIGNLNEKLEQAPITDCSCAIGHTRWATHGGPSDTNAHPHRAGSVVLVHNGIIENYKELKEEMLVKGHRFLSETDTEVAAAIINDCYKTEKDPIAAIRKATSRMTGSYAFGILFDDQPGSVFAARKGSPLILAKGADGYYLASDITALLPFTKQYFPLNEGEIAHLTPDDAVLYSADIKQIEIVWKTTTMTAASAQRGGYPHFMLKEIHEEPGAIVKSVSSRIVNGLPDFSADNISPEFWKEVKAIHVVACGSAMHAGIVGGKLIEKLAGVPTSIFIASEYRYFPPIAEKGTLVLIISQSGETADSLAALRDAKSRGLMTLGVVNAVETSIAREADKRIYTYAGPEIAVATTKGYCTQASVLYMIAAALGLAKGKLSEAKAREIVKSVAEDAPKAMEAIISDTDRFREIAKQIYKRDHIFYIGRGMDYALSLEAALKLKEISYIHCEAYAAGELKHGTISLIEDGTPVIALSTDASIYDKTESNVREVKSRGAYQVLVCREDAPTPEKSADIVVKLPISSEAATFFSALAVIQLLAYEVASLRGCDIDRPRNLAKSVTVE